MSFVVASSVVLLALQIFQCVPVRVNWEGWTGNFGPHWCLNVNLLAYVAAGVSIGQDLIILLLPLPLLYKLKVPTRAKVAIMIMFSLGIFILITSCIRLRYFIMFARSTNPTWDYADALIWSGVEVAVSIIITSLPAIRVLLSRSFPRLFGSHGNSSGKYKASDRSGSSGSKPEFNRKLKSLNSIALFSLRSRNASGEPNESQLELGDRIKGNVQTDIGVMDRSDWQADSQDGRGDGIRVMTTTTKTLGPHDMEMRSPSRSSSDERGGSFGHS